MTLTWRPPSLMGLSHEELATQTDRAMARIYEVVGNLSAAVGTPVNGVVPDPLPDGTLKLFTWPSVPDPPSSLKVFVGGVLMMAIADYTLNGAIITFVSAPILGANIVGWYQTK